MISNRQNILYTTPTILTCAITSIITSLCLLHQTWILLIFMSSLIMLAAYITNRYLLLAIIICSICIGIRIQYIQKTFTNNADFFSKPLIVKGVVQQIQHNSQQTPTTTILLKTSCIYTKELGTLSQAKLISIQMPQRKGRFLQEGQFISLYKLKLNQPQENNPYRTYLIKEGIWATGFITTENMFISKKYMPTWYQKIFINLKQHHSKTIQRLFNPLFLGKKEKDQEALTVQHQSQFCGIAHHMARSGIHLVTLIGLFISLFKFAQIRNRFRFIIFGTLAIFYWFISISSISFLRSLCMILCQMFSKIHGFKYSSIHAFGLTTLCVIAYNPHQVLFLDFQLSFGITAVIIWLFYSKWTKTVAFPLSALVPF